MTNALWVLLWLIVVVVGVCIYGMVGLTLSKLDRPSVGSRSDFGMTARDTLPLRLGVTLALTAAEGMWLAWAAMTTNFGQGSAQNMCAVFVGGTGLILGIIVLWLADAGALQVGAQVMWPLALAGWLMGGFMVWTSSFLARGVTNRASALAAIIGSRTLRGEWLTDEGREFERLKAEAQRDLGRLERG